MYDVCESEGCEWVLLTAPTEEPLSILDAKAQARVTHDEEDSLWQSYISAARAAAEEHMSRGLLTQTWKLILPAFADSIWLPMAAPLQSVTSVKYYDTAGAQQTLSTTVYDVDTTSRPGRIVRKPLQTWPSVQSDRLATRIEITYVVGWTAKELIPERIRQGLRLHVGYLDCDREGLDEYGEQARKAAEACWSDRVYWKPPAFVW
jgi:uncharacterized phiE125 gp8 family phage protein